MRAGDDSPAVPEAPDDVTLGSYDAASEKYVRASQRSRGEVLRFLDAFAELVGFGTVLEIGSGPGWDADHLERRGLRVIRTDGATSFVDRLHELGHEARVLDIRTDPLGGPYDAVLANAVLLHLSRGEFLQSLSRARRAVRSGGLLGFTLKEGDGEGWSQATIDLPRHFTYWREPELRSALTTTGWRVVSLEHVNGRQDDWLFVLAKRSDVPSEIPEWDRSRRRHAHRPLWGIG